MSASPSHSTVIRIFSQRGSSPFAQGFIIAAALLLVLLLIPLVVIGAIGAVAVFGAIKAKAWLDRARNPNGVLDGRRNVRVRLPGE
jgi:hypothetical protein